MSETVEDLAYVERVKGWGFVFVTSVGLFALTGVLLRRVRRPTEHIAERKLVLHRAEQAATAGLFASSPAHDMKNLLHVARMNLELMPPVMPEIGDQWDHRGEIETSLERITKLAESLMSVARKDHEKRVEFDAVAAVREALKPAGTHPAVKACRIEMELPEDPVLVSGYPQLLHRALLNLVLNAGEAAGTEGYIRLRLSRPEPGSVRFEVHDHGAGIPPESHGRILEPRFTTKQLGTGRGLFSVQACAQEHGGSIEVEDSPLGGALLTLRLAVADRDEPLPTPA